MTIKLPPYNIFDRILNIFGKERKIIIPKETAKIYKEMSPYIQIRAKKEGFLRALFRKEK